MSHSLLQLLFDFLAFKNDISFWKQKKSMVGMSSKAGSPACSRTRNKCRTDDRLVNVRKFSFIRQGFRKVIVHETMTQQHVVWTALFTQ